MQKAVSLVFMFGLIVLSGSSSAQAASLLFTPSTQVVNVGQSVQVALQIAGLGDRSTPSLGAFDLNVQLANGLGFRPNGVAFGNQLNLGNPAASIQGFTTLTPNRANLFEVSLLPSNTLNTQQAGAFTLATFTLNALRPAQTGIGLLSPPGILADASGHVLSIASLPTGRVTVTPEPGAFVLLGTFLALGLLFAWHLRRQGA